MNDIHTRIAVAIVEEMELFECVGGELMCFCFHVVDVSVVSMAN
jgi:hypothetical protein